jgi:hypothetical protein
MIIIVINILLIYKLNINIQFTFLLSLFGALKSRPATSALQRFSLPADKCPPNGAPGCPQLPSGARTKK